MARLARVVIPGLPHHVTQRGNRRQQTFFDDEDFQKRLEKKLGRVLRRQKPGPKRASGR
jgi:REP element-mobilizing transposase RayT